MARAAILLLAGLLLPACGDGNGSPGAGASTLAYVVNSCSLAGGQETVQQELRILRGEKETVTAISVGPLGPFVSGGLCAQAGSWRGFVAPRIGPFQRLGVTADGSGVVFELTDEFAQVGRNLLPAEQRGMYYVRADGSGLRPIGPASRFPSFHFSPKQDYARATVLNFAPDGRQFTYVDLGPDADGEDAPQVFVRDAHTGAATQLTRLPPLDTGWFPDIWKVFFIDARTLLFSRFFAPPDKLTYLTVDLEGHVSDLDRAVELPGGSVIPVFEIIGAEWYATFADQPRDREPENPFSDLSAYEIFVQDGRNVLQLTDYNRVDTASHPPFFGTFDGRAYFTSSADPLGTNPDYDCQIFSEDALSRDLRQVTSFHSGRDHRAEVACFGVSLAPGTCRIGFTSPTSQDSATGTLYFRSQCDPLGQNPHGVQLFAIEADGSGLRQLTDVRGYVRIAPGVVEVESVELFAYGPYR
jgi:hypothetical protein